MKNQKKSRVAAGIFTLLVLTILFSCKKDHTVDQAVDEKQNITKFHDLKIDGQLVTIKEDSGQYFFADDVILTAEQFAMLRRMANPQTSAKERSTITTNLNILWPNGTVYYTLNLGTDNKYAEQAMRNISAVAPIRFIARTSQSNYVSFIKSSTTNSSSLGMVKGGQQLKLINSNNVGIITHEILHALGINHEQCRPDRGNSIKVYLENVGENHKHNFNIDPSYRGLGPFDFGSIMMYGPYAFSNNQKPTITKLNGSTYTAQVNNLSQGDINGLNELY